MADSGDPAAPAGIDPLVDVPSLGIGDRTAQPVGFDGLSGQVVAKLMFRPWITAVPRAAQARGCRIVTGDAMLLPRHHLLPGQALPQARSVR